MTECELTPAEIRQAAECAIFPECDEAETRAFLERSEMKAATFSGGEVIPGETRAGCWSIVLSGSVRIYSGCGGEDRMLLNVVSAGQPFDIASLAGCGSGQAITEAVAAGRSRVLFIRAMEPTGFMKEYPQIAAGCMRFFCDRIGFLNRRLHTLSRSTAERRLADYLLSEFSTDSGNPEVRVKSCAELAFRLNLSRASLYRALGVLEQSGMILRRGKLIALRDIPALQNL